MRDLREAAQRVVDNATPATESAANYFVWKHQLDHLRDALAAPPPAPSYEALLLIAQSVSGALERAGVAECDDPGEAIDVLRKRWEASSESGDLMHAILETPRAAYLAERLATPQPPKPAAYNRSLIAEIIRNPSCFTQEAKDEQALLLEAADNADAAGVHTASKPAGAVPLPEALEKVEVHVDFGSTSLKPRDKVCTIADTIRYGDAREAAALIKSTYSNSSNTCVDSSAGRADAVPDGWGRIPQSITESDAPPHYIPSEKRAYAAGFNWCVAAAQTTMIPAPAPQQMTTQGERSAFQMIEEQEAAKAEPAGREAVAEGDEKILWGVVANAGRLSKERKVRWSHVSDATGQGSNYSADLCRRFGFDPNEEVGGRRHG